MARKLNVAKHYLVPKHEKISEKEKKELLDAYRVTPAELPKILLKDPAIQHLSAKEGDIIRITRTSPTAGVTVFYRAVIGSKNA